MIGRRIPRELTPSALSLPSSERAAPDRVSLDSLNRWRRIFLHYALLIIHVATRVMDQDENRIFIVRGGTLAYGTFVDKLA